MGRRVLVTGAARTTGRRLVGALAEEPEVERVRVSIEEHAWRPIGNAPDAFTRDGSETRTAAVAVGRDEAGVGTAGRANDVFLVFEREPLLRAAFIDYLSK